MTKTELKKMTVADVLKTPEYESQLQRLMDVIWESREQAREKAILRNQILKAHPIDGLHEVGIWQPVEMIAEYMAVIDKKSKLPEAAREYIREVGTSAYINTLKQFQNETKGNKRIRKNK